VERDGVGGEQVRTEAGALATGRQRSSDPEQSMNDLQHDQRGFSLVESMIALGVVTVGVLGLAQVYVLGINHLMGASAGLVAREKAREAIESIHAARDARTLTWVQMRNVAAPSGCSGAATGGGAFLNGYQPLYKAGADGLVNTSNATPVMETSPGPNGRLGDADDVPLTNYQRDIRFCDIDTGLREITVTIQYNVGGRAFTFSLKSLISSFS
jgi:prepilin-type N-terminal cleavage/methylation domain-containing protein